MPIIIIIIIIIIIQSLHTAAINIIYNYNIYFKILFLYYNV